MKIHVITDASGQVIGTARLPETAGGNPGSPRIDPGPGGKVHEIELGDDIGNERDPDRLHAALKEHLQRGK